MIRIADLHSTQRKLWRPETLQNLVGLEYFETRIVLFRCPDGEIEVGDGHHRLTALYLKGKQGLKYGEYLLVESDRTRQRFGKMKVWCKRYGGYYTRPHKSGLEVLVGCTRHS